MWQERAECTVRGPGGHAPRAIHLDATTARDRTRILIAGRESTGEAVPAVD
jgi:hypothetical protein